MESWETTPGLYPPPPETLTRRGWRGAFRFMGTGAIIASVTVGSGELVWASRSGAIFGYQMLWCFLLAGLFKFVQVFSAARHLTLTGEHPLASWRYLSISILGRRLSLAFIIAAPTLLVMPIAFSGISEILGNYLYGLTSHSSAGSYAGTYGRHELWENIWATAILTICLFMAITSNLQTVERVSALVVSLIILCAFISVVTCKPDLIAIASGLCSPRVPEYENWVLTQYSNSFTGRSPWLEIALYLGAVGGGTYDYIGYLGTLRQKQWGLAGKTVASRDTLEQAMGTDTFHRPDYGRARIWTRAPLLDTSASFAVVILITLLFAVLGASLLHPHQMIPDNQQLLSQQETFLTSLHPQLIWVYRVGVCLALIGTLYGAFELYQHTVTESVLAILPSWATPPFIPVWRYATITYCYLGGMLMIWLPQEIAGNVVGRMTFGAVISGATLSGVWCLAMIWTDRVRLPKALQMGWLLWWSTLIAGIAMTALGIQTLVVYFS